MNIIKSFEFAAPNAIHTRRRLVIVERTEGFYSITEQYFYSAKDESGTVFKEGWANLPSAFGIFESEVLAEAEVRRHLSTNN